MKVTIEQNPIEFHPIDLNIRIETKQELEMYYHIFKYSNLSEIIKDVHNCGHITPNIDRETFDKQTISIVEKLEELTVNH